MLKNPDGRGRTPYAYQAAVDVIRYSILATAGKAQNSLNPGETENKKKETKKIKQKPNKTDSHQSRERRTGFGVHFDGTFFSPPFNRFFVFFHFRFNGGSGIYIYIYKYMLKKRTHVCS